MLGTLVACAAVLTFLAWFPQERWWFMVVVSLYDLHWPAVRAGCVGSEDL